MKKDKESREEKSRRWTAAEARLLEFLAKDPDIHSGMEAATVVVTTLLHLYGTAPNPEYKAALRRLLTAALGRVVLDEPPGPAPEA